MRAEATTSTAQAIPVGWTWPGASIPTTSHHRKCQRTTNSYEINSNRREPLNLSSSWSLGGLRDASWTRRRASPAWPATLLPCPSGPVFVELDNPFGGVGQPRLAARPTARKLAIAPVAVTRTPQTRHLSCVPGPRSECPGRPRSRCLRRRPRSRPHVPSGGRRSCRTA